MKKLFFIILMTIAVFSAQGQHFHVKSSAKDILIGEQFKIDLNAEALEDADIVWPKPPDSTHNWLLVNRSGIDTTLRSGTIALHETWIVTSFDSGFALIEPLQISINNNTLKSQPILIQVDIPPVSDELHDIAEPIAPGLGTAEIVVITASGVLFLLLCYFIILWAIRLRRKRVAKGQTDRRPPHIQALEELIQIEENTDWQNIDNAVESLGKAIQIFHRYCRKAHGLDVGDINPDEVSEKWQRTATVDTPETPLRDLLKTADRVRFARESLTEEEYHRWITEIRTWIERAESSIKTTE